MAPAGFPCNFLISVLFPFVTIILSLVARWLPMAVSEVLGGPKSSFGFFLTIFWKNTNELFGLPSTKIFSPEALRKPLLLPCQLNHMIISEPTPGKELRLGQAQE